MRIWLKASSQHLRDKFPALHEANPADFMDWGIASGILMMCCSTVCITYFSGYRILSKGSTVDVPFGGVAVPYIYLRDR